MDRILLLEDDEALALGVEFTLKDEGYEVVRCSSVSDAKTNFDEGKYDIAILDIMLPDGSGYDVCKYIKQKSSIPIIFLTACDEEANVVMGLDIGADDYVTKPFRVRELISRINAVLRRTKAKSREARILKSGDIELNTETAAVKKNGVELSLSSQEYKLLIIFMSNPGSVMSREQVLDKLIEGSGAYFDTNTLSVYIRRIREKIEDDSSNPMYIKTVRGLGYKWDVEVK